MPSIAIVGGGLSGLATAWNILKHHPDAAITLFESSDRLGGKISSQREQGFLYEHGPNGFMDSRQEMVDFCRELNLDEHIVKSNDAARERFILRQGKLRRLPKKPPQMFTWNFLPLTARLRLLKEPFINKSSQDDETVYDFCRRRLGKTVAEYLVDPFTSGVFGADCRELSVRAAFPALWEMEQQYGCLFKGLKAKMKASKGKPQGKLSSFKNGMEQLITTLAEKMAGKVQVRLNSAVQALNKTTEGIEILSDDNGQGQRDTFDLAILACPAYQAGKMIKSIYGSIADKVENIPYSAITVVPQGFNKPRPEVLKAFGFLIPSSEPVKIMGTLFDSSIFPGRAANTSFSLRSMIGGGKNPEMINSTDEEISELMNWQNEHILGIRQKADFIKIIRWKQAIPVYKMGHCRLVKEIEEATANDPVFITGNAFYGVSMNDCITAAAATANKIKGYLEK